MQSAEQIVASSVTLVTLPAIFTAVKKVVDDPDTTAMDLARVIFADPAMTARVLKLINSAFWGMNRQIDSLSRAVSLLGMLQVHDMVLSTSVVETFDRMRPDRMDVARFWRGSVFRGLAATALARKGKLVDLGRVFTEGLMSDLGHMVLYTKLPVLALQASDQTRDRPCELAPTEMALIGCDYAQVGAALTDLWQLPPCFGSAIRHQNDPEQAGSFALEAALLHIAGLLFELPAGARERAEQLARITPFAWRTIGLAADCVPEILAEVDANLLATARMFGVPLGAGT